MVSKPSRVCDAHHRKVSLKLGGIGMPIDGTRWHRRPTPPSVAEMVDTWAGPIRWCIEQFGVERCMFESNFPVDRLSMSYATLWSAFDGITADLEHEQRAALFHDTAAAVYRLDDPTIRSTNWGAS